MRVGSIFRCVVAHPGMRVTRTQGARQTRAHSHPVGQMQCVKGTVRQRHPVVTQDTINETHCDSVRLSI